MERTPSKRQYRKLTLEKRKKKKNFHRSSRRLNPRPSDDESGAVPTELSPTPSRRGSGGDQIPAGLGERDSVPMSGTFQATAELQDSELSESKKKKKGFEMHFECELSPFMILTLIWSLLCVPNVTLSPPERFCILMGSTVPLFLCVCLISL